MFDLTAYLHARRRAIESVLNSVLPLETEPPQTLHRAMRYAVLEGGKRLRPILCMAAAEAVGGRTEAAALPGAAVEMLHAYTLIHDDLPCMDDDSERRGRPSCHIAFGEANAVLAGNALQSLAFEVLAGAIVERGCKAVRLVRELAAAAGARGVVGGQAVDIEAAQAEHAPAADTLDFIHRRKTAALFRAALRIGAIAAGAAESVIEKLGLYGENLGLAFQIIDDLLDEGTDTGREQPCRSKGLWSGHGSLSCLSLITPVEARQRAMELIESARAALASLTPSGSAPLHSIAEFVLSRRS